MVLANVQLVLIQLDGARRKLELEDPLLDNTVFVFLDNLLLLIQPFHEVLAVPSEKLKARRQIVIVIDIKIHAPQEVGVNFLLEIHFESC